jgi:predicted nucleic acid-binding protein
MPAKQFFGTNILICAFASNDPRSARAESLLAEGGVIGVQVLNEFANVTRCSVKIFSTARSLGR